MRPMKRVLLSSWLVALVLAVGMPAVVSAVPPPPPGCTKNCNNPPAPKNQSGSSALTTPDNCVQIALPIFGNNTCVQNNKGNGSAVIIYLRDVLKLISSAVGITVIIMIIVAGIQYITSTGDPSNIKNAKNRLVNALIALLLFLMMFAILQFLVPGGIL